MTREKTPAEVLEEFLQYIDQWEDKYKEAFEEVGKEDKKLQDLLHELEFTSNGKEKNCAATKLRDSRRARRQSKNTVLLYENIVKFFQDSQNRKVLNQLRQLLGNQRRQEKMLMSERTYRPRVEELSVGMKEFIK